MVRKLLELNGLAILCVLLFHAAGWGFVAMFSWAHRYQSVAPFNNDQFGGLSYFALRAIDQFVVFCIPAFLFVTGYFVAVATGRERASLHWDFVGARLTKLLIPYVLWSGVAFVFLYVQGRTLSGLDILTMLATGRTYEVYYYVPLVCQMYLLSPLLVPVAKKRWVLLLLVTGCIQFCVQLLYYPALLGTDLGVLQPLVDVIPKWFFPSRIFWFALGMVAGFHSRELKSYLLRYKRPLLVTAILLIPLGIVEWELILRASGQSWLGNRETLLDTFYAAAVILGFIAHEDVLFPHSTHLHKLATMSFGIYLIHPPVMEVVARGLYHFAPSILALPLALVSLLFVTGLGVPLLLMTLVNHTPARVHYRYAFG